MTTIDETFLVRNARSVALGDHGPGDVAFVTNGMKDNGIVGYVTPLERDRVFDKQSLVLSAFCEATVQLPPFIARGNGGSGLIVLEPREETPVPHLAYIAAYVNQALRWRFNWYRQASADRVLRLRIPSAPPPGFVYPVTSHVPVKSPPVPPIASALPCFRPFVLDELFELRAGTYHELHRLAPGATPVISCGDTDNGVAGYFSVPPTDEARLTIALNGSTLSTKYHPYAFATKDDVAVCKPRLPLRLSSLLVVQIMLNRERWRYSYYRKCYLQKLRRFEVPLPAKGDDLDEDAMEKIIGSTPYWSYLNAQLSGQH